ncbi:hypothetical protein Dsin_026994 [Dipteronia sinensis]|uniref:RNase H type-1 domain-containing protein n=1 Tax=Dipteronia sinensis TaxID=43782 RepID=A0AAD9ZZP4_9ROSI|nr:hypothetical protein Dsin_026994 [Dipteronia sinensis]
MSFVVVWTIWEARNSKLFKNGKANLNQAVDMVQFRIAWWFKHYGTSSMDPITYMLLNIKDRCTDATKVKSPKIEEWIPPSFNTLKFNVDWSARSSPGQARIGGVLIRDHRGKVLCIFSANVGIQDAITAELLAIAKACALCASNSALDGKIFCFVTDSKITVSWINSGGIGSVKQVQIIYDIRSYLNSLTQAQVVFSPGLLSL